MADMELIRYLSELCKINMSEKELKSKAEEMSSIINLMDGIKEVEICNNNLISDNCIYYGDLEEDITEDSFGRGEIMKNAKGVREGYFSVPKVV